MSADLQHAVSRIVEVVMFENWLRFYFIAEQGEKLLLKLPEKAMEQIKKRYAPFYELAERLNNVEVDHNTSLREVCLFVSGGFDGAPLPEELVARVFESSAFQMELQLFSYWVQAHEEHLDSAFMEFSEWRRLFDAWKLSDEVKEYRAKLAENPLLGQGASSDTVQ